MVHSVCFVFQLPLWITFNFTLFQRSSQCRPTQIFSGPPELVQGLAETDVVWCETQLRGWGRMKTLGQLVELVTKQTEGADPSWSSCTSHTDGPVSSLRGFEVWLKMLQLNFALHLSLD